MSKVAYRGVFWMVMAGMRQACSSESVRGEVDAMDSRMAQLQGTATGHSSKAE